MDRSRPDTGSSPSDGGPDADDDSGEFPAIDGGRGRRRGLKIALAVVLALAVVAAGSAGALVMYGRSSVVQTPIAGISAREDSTITLASGETVTVMNVLLIGTDDRSTLDDDERERMNIDLNSGRRADTLMLAQLEVGGTGAALLSFPRDLRVELCDGRVDKINAAFAAGARSGIGEESCLVQTVTAFTGIDIHHYVEVDFRGFMEVVDVLGGVTMYLDRPMRDVKANLDVPQGCVTLDSEQALGFVRSRGYDDDFGRIARQQRFVREVVEELGRVGVFANPPRLFSLVDRAAKAVRTDDGLGLGDMRDIALGLRRITSDGLQGQTVPSTPQTIDGISYVIADDEPAAATFASFRDGSVLRDVPEASPDADGEDPAVAEPEAPPADEPAAEVVVPPVTVHNATDINGLGAAAAQVLEAGGLPVGEVGNADQQGASATEVVHGPGLAEAAQSVAEAFGVGVVREDPEVEGVRVILGADTDRATLEQRVLALTEDTGAEEPAPPAESDMAEAHAEEPPADAQHEPEPEPQPEADPGREYIGTVVPPDVEC
jgi:LCP family protein required for cell wall assembly